MFEAIMLFLTCFLCLMTFVYSAISQIAYAKRIGRGGKMSVFLNYSLIFLSFTQLIIVVIIIKGHFSDHPVMPLMALLLFLFAAASMAFSILRKRQNIGYGHIENQTIDSMQVRNAIMTNVSHEIRTPMNNIIGLTEILLKKNNLDYDTREQLNNISKAGSSLIGVVNNLIDFVKIDSDKLDIIESEYSTKELVAELINKANFMLADKSVDFMAEIDPMLPSTLRGDDVRIIQAVGNVLTNACKYTNMGIIILKVNSSRIDNERISLNFFVEDTGVGISDEHKAAVFGTALKTIPGKRLGGAGLGLLITKAVTEMMNGKISFTSNEGEGTSFSLNFIQRVKDASPIGDIQAELSSKKLVTGRFTAPMARVLIVDDNIVNLYVAKEIIGNYKIDVTTVSSGEECLQVVGENYFDIIFMDYVMPGLDGHQTLLKLRQPDSEYFRKIPVVALTAQISTGSDRVYMEEGFQAVLSKPLDIPSLESVLLKFLPEEYICQSEEAPVEIESVEDKNWYRRICNVLTDFDVKEGLSHCGNDYTSFINLLRVIYNDGYSQLSKLESSFKEGNADDYMVTAHSMKAVSASAGAMKLSFICAEHEKAARGSDMTYIENHYSTLYAQYEEFLHKIDILLRRESEMVNKGFTSHREKLSDGEIMKLISDLRCALEDYNVDDAEKVITKLSHAEIPFDQEKALENINDMLMLFKYDEAIAIIDSTWRM